LTTNVSKTSRKSAAARAADAARSRKYAAENKEQVLANKAAYYQQNRERILTEKAAYRAANKREIYFRNIKNKFGLTKEHFFAMLDEQDGKCDICSEPFVFGEGRRKTACVDHCHETGVIRGLLCGGCNTGIGNLRDDPKLLRRAARYLESCK